MKLIVSPNLFYPHIVEWILPFLAVKQLNLYVLSIADIGGTEGPSAEEKEKLQQLEQERLEALREAEERRTEKHRKMEEEREGMRQGIRDKVWNFSQFYISIKTVLN